VRIVLAGERINVIIDNKGRMAMYPLRKG